MNQPTGLVTLLFFFLFSTSLFSQTTIRLEDEATFTSGLCAFEGARQNSYTGANNGYYINIQNANGKGITWKVDVPSSGSYQLVWRYANAGSKSSTTGRVLVNGATAVSNASFPKTSSWSTWTTSASTVTLAAGVNTVRLETSSSNEFANIDWIEITGNGPTAAPCSGTAVTNYTLTTANSPSAGGNVTSSPSGTSFASGTSVTLTATPAAGYTFSGWSGDLSGTTNPATVVMNSDKTITANYVQQGGTTQYTLTVNTTGSGTVTLNPSGGVYDAGTVVTLTANPASGYSFSGWSGALSGNSNPATITMNSNQSVTAAFTQNTGGSTPDFSMIGYATLNGGTTGGQGGPSVTITTLAELQSWALSRENNTAPQIAYISGKISASQTTVVTVKHGANVSILGVGSTAELQNVGLKIWNYDNVIVRNLKIHEVLYPNDALTLDDVINGWVDHCEFYSQIGAGIGVDTYDGLLDIKNGSRNITVSWNYMHHHMKNMLFGHTEGSTQAAIDGQMRITLHHNFIESTNGRNPSLRYGAVHMFNNYFRDINDYGMASRVGAHALVQNNLYENVNIPLTTNKFAGEGFICESGNIFTNCGANSITQTGCNFWTASELPYSYSLDQASSLSTLLPPNVGVGKVNVGSPARTITGNRSQLQVIVHQNYPNPFTGTTTFRIYSPSVTKAVLTLFDANGRKVAVIADKILAAGEHHIPFDGKGLSSGIYFYEVQTNEELIRKTLVIR